MKFKEDRPFATPDAAERKLLELANAMEADHAARLSVGVINKQFRDAGGSYEDSDVPLFLSDHDEEREPLDTGKVWYRAAISSRNLKTSILVVTAAAIVFAILAVGNPVALFTNATASLVGISAPQSGTGESTPAVQSSSSAQASPAARDAPTHAEIVAAFNTAHQSQTEIRQPPAEALLKQFQAWATEQDARAQVQKQR